MPVVPFDALPASARVWVFASDRALSGPDRSRLLGAVDAYLGNWRAHGQPLTCARVWRDDRFLAVGVDQTPAYASGCSIDGLFRALQALRPILRTSLVTGGRVFYREAGEIRSVSQDEFTDLSMTGAVTAETSVFDLTVSTAGEWRERFTIAAGRTWHQALLAAGASIRTRTDPHGHPPYPPIKAPTD
jgi:hypothetical protein